LGLDAEVGGGPEDLVHVRVDDFDDISRGRVRA
jgi:hypothetical protein